MAIGFNNEQKVLPKILINIGATLDVPTGSYVTGAKGESILNGGLSKLTGVIGVGNNFKSSISHYMMLSAANKIYATTPTAMTTYDTEVNVDIYTLEKIAERFSYLPPEIVTGGQTWIITDKATECASTWFSKISQYCEIKAKDKADKVKFTAFLNPYTKETLEIPIPTFGEIDSLTEFEPKASMDKVADNIEDSNTVFLNSGAFKTKVLSQMPRLTNISNTFFIVTAQVGGKIDMATGPAKYSQPSRKLQYMKSGDDIKGVTSKFTFLTSNAWQAHTASALINPTTKQAEYPKSNKEVLETDLNIVKLTQMRSKSGPAGYTLNILVSQTDGVLPTLTEFHNVKTNGKFGIDGNDRSYWMVLYPDVKLSRTTVRSLTDEDPLLQRAINITSELLQLHKFHQRYAKFDLLCTAEELYKDLTDLGYDWGMILKTRGWWAIDQYSTNLRPFLSTLDLLKMRKGLYTPYFLNEDKTVKKEYIKCLEV